MLPGVHLQEKSNAFVLSLYAANNFCKKVFPVSSSASSSTTFLIIKISKPHKYLELLTLVSEKRPTQLHVQSKRSVLPVEEDIKKKKKANSCSFSHNFSTLLCDSKTNQTNTEIIQCIREN